MIEPDRLKALRGAIGRFAHALEAGDTATLESLLSLGYKHTDKSDKLWSRRECWHKSGRSQDRQQQSTLAAGVPF